MNNYVAGSPFFTSVNKNKIQYNYLTKDIETDVLVIGGGITGAINAYYFSKNNIKTTLIEKSRIAHLSTSVTTSLLQYELDDTLMNLKEVLGLSNAINIYKLCIDALDEVYKFSKTYGNDFDYIKRDCLFYTNKNLSKKEIYDEYKLRKENNFDVLYTEEEIANFNLKAGLISKNGGCEIDPYKFTHSLLREAKNNNCEIFENTEAKSLTYENDYIVINTNFDYKIRAKKVIIATGYNTNLFTKQRFGTKYNTFNIVTKPIKDLKGYENKFLIRDNNSPYHYLRTTVDNRIIMGGEDVSFNLIDNEKVSNEKYEILEQKLKQMFNKTDIEIDYKYCGCFETTVDNLGVVGEDKNHKNLWYCLGYGANGILFAILGAKMLIKLYNNEVDDNLKLFYPYRKL